jgi:hypothetical protein
MDREGESDRRVVIQGRNIINFLMINCVGGDQELNRGGF